MNFRSEPARRERKPDLRAFGAAPGRTIRDSSPASPAQNAVGTLVQADEKEPGQRALYAGLAPLIAAKSVRL